MRLTGLALAALAGLVLAQAPSLELKQTAASAIEMLRAGQSAAWSVLRATNDNTVRSLVIRDLPQSVVSSALVIQRLSIESDVSIRRALLLALGGYPKDSVPSPQRDSLVMMMRDLYDKDPDSGIHAAVQWVGRTDGCGTRVYAYLDVPVSGCKR